LWCYAKNRFRNLFYDKDADISRVLNDALQVTPNSVTVSGQKAVPGSAGPKSA
jgi:hypothetical protein